MKITRRVWVLGVGVVAVMGALNQLAWGVGDTAFAQYTGTHITDGTIKVWGDSFLLGQNGIGGVYILNLGATSGMGDNIVTQLSGPNAGQVYAFCIDLPQTSDLLPHLFDVQLPRNAPVPPTYGSIGVTKETYLRELWGKYFATAITSGVLAETFSAAVWEIIYEDLPADPSGWDVTSPDPADVDGTSFRAADAGPNMVDVVTANLWLHSLDGTGPLANLRALTHPDFQDFLVEVPEPATVVLLGAGGLLMALGRTRKGDGT